MKLLRSGWTMFAGILLLLAGFACLQQIRPARANVPCSLPVTLTNGTIADATQVMANFNALVTCLGNAAAAGNNTDITALLGLTSPISPNFGGTAIFIGGTSTGSANAQIVATTTPNNFSLTTGFRVTFIAGFGNGAATTLNVGGTGAKNVFRKTQLGASTTQGGEILAGSPYEVVYDGTEFILANEFFLVGEQKDWVTLAAPAGWLIEDGSAVSRTTFATLFAVQGTACGNGDGSTTFNLCDLRGRTWVGLDNMGTAAGAANRLTNVATGCGTAMTTIGAVCANGLQNHQLVLAETPSFGYTPAGTVNTNNSLQLDTQSPPTQIGTGSAVAARTDGNAANLTFSGTPATLGGSNGFHNITNPNIGMLKIIRY